jgi:hypothetical protein
LYSNDGEHWKLKAEISWLKERIEKYMLGFNPDYLMKFEFEKGITNNFGYYLGNKIIMLEVSKSIQ